MHFDQTSHNTEGGAEPKENENKWYRVFRNDSPTKQVYEEAAKEVALSVLSGINSSIFAYGQTSSGKTYTMSGITDFAIADIFNYIEKRTEREFVLKFSALEIYNESVRDLLSVDGTPLRLLDDPKGFGGEEGRMGVEEECGVEGGGGTGKKMKR
ncbi:hypothetical protein JHK84_043095 [Glycine max]|nr:hypothetical protein JHK84_043095 [Glycine max]